MHRILLAVLFASFAVACAGDRPDTAVSPRLDSGVTSSNGGGARVLNSQPGMSVTTQVGPSR